MVSGSNSAALDGGMTVSTRIVSELVLAVERAGVERAAFIDAAGVEPWWLETDDMRLPVGRIFELCSVALDMTGDPAFGLHWGQALANNAFNVVSHLLTHAATLRQSIDALSRFVCLLSDNFEITLIEDGALASLRATPPGGSSAAIRRLNAEMIGLGLFRMVGHFCGPAERIERVSFEHGAPAYRNEYERVFGDAVRFDQPFTGVSFQRSLLEARSPQRDAGLYATLSDLAEQRLVRLDGRAPFSVRIRQHLLAQPAPHRVPMAQTARALDISVRSLQRRLAEEGLSYVAITNDVAAQVARQHLVDAGHTIQQSAHAMGFASVSAFHRAVRRWTGKTPKALSTTKLKPDEY